MKSERQSRLNLYQTALYDLQKMNGQKVSGQQFSKDHHISQHFLTACEKMGVIEKSNAHVHWKGGVKVDMFLAQDIIKLTRVIREKYKHQRWSRWLQEEEDACYNETESRYLNALNLVKARSGRQINAEEFQTKMRVAARFFLSCIELGILYKDGRKYFWIYQGAVDENLAAKVKNQNNPKTRAPRIKNQWQTVQMFCSTYSISRNTLYEWIKSGKLEKMASGARTFVRFNQSPEKKKPEPQPKAAAPKTKAQPQQAPVREQRSISILWGMISIKY